QVQGPSVFSNTSSGAFALQIVSAPAQKAVSSGALAISAYGSARSPHILFGSGTTFDTNLFRSAAKTLKTTGTFQAGTLSGNALQVMGGNSYLLGNVGIGKSGTPT